MDHGISKWSGCPPIPRQTYNSKGHKGWSSAKYLSHKFFVIMFTAPKWGPKLQSHSPYRDPKPGNTKTFAHVKSMFGPPAENGPKVNSFWERRTGLWQSTPLSTMRIRYRNSVSTPEATRTCKTQQNALQKGSRRGISVSTPHRRDGHDCGRQFYGRPFRLSGPISRDIAILSLRYPISRDTF